MARKSRSKAAKVVPVNQLLDVTLKLRTDAFAAFEEACKAAGLMAHKPSQRSRNAKVR